MVGPRSRFRRAVREVPLRRAPNGGPAIIAAGLARWIIHSLPPAPGMEPPDGIRRVASASWSRQEDADPGLDACQAKPFAKKQGACGGRRAPAGADSERWSGPSLPCGPDAIRRQRAAEQSGAE